MKKIGHDHDVPFTLPKNVADELKQKHGIDAEAEIIQAIRAAVSVKDMTPGSPHNQSSNTFTDISSEEWREYNFAGGDKVLINRPTHLSVSSSGHRLLDESGISHYVPKGWNHLRWAVRPGQPHFVK